MTYGGFPLTFVPSLRSGQALVAYAFRCSVVNGQGGIRTLDTLASMPPFQGGAFNHSATCPEPLQGGNLVLSERKINVSLTGE